jgi:hypothetical protein
LRQLRRLLDFLRVSLVRLQHEIAHTLLSRGIINRTQQREATPLTMGGELTRREGDVLACAVPTRPDAEADQLQAIELATGEVEFGVRERQAPCGRCE